MSSENWPPEFRSANDILDGLSTVNVEAEKLAKQDPTTPKDWYKNTLELIIKVVRGQVPDATADE